MFPIMHYIPRTSIRSGPSSYRSYSEVEGHHVAFSDSSEDGEWGPKDAEEGVWTKQRPQPRLLRETLQKAMGSSVTR